MKTGKPTNLRIRLLSSISVFVTPGMVSCYAAQAPLSENVNEDVEDVSDEPDASLLPKLSHQNDVDPPLLPEDAEFAAFADSARRSVVGQEVFVVEEDLVFETEAHLREYFAARRTSSPDGTIDKAIVNLNNGERDVRADGQPSTNVSEFTYCFRNGRWGDSIDTDSDGTPEIMPTIAQVRPGLEGGMRAWEGVANVRFIYRSDLNGSGCATSGVSFSIELDTGSPCTATGPFPSRSNQALTVPVCGLPELLAIHELGHTLGFRHEHIHSQASPRCSEGDSSFEELFSDYDSVSSMVYANCSDGSGVIGGFRVSRLDGMGARLLYGNPDWWAVML